MSLLGSVSKIHPLVLLLLLNAFAKSQAVQKFPAAEFGVSMPRKDTTRPCQAKHVPVCLHSSPEGDKLEGEEDNPAFVPIQPLAFSPKAFSKGVNYRQLWQPAIGPVPQKHLLNYSASKQLTDGHDFHSLPTWALKSWQAWKSCLIYCYSPWTLHPSHIPLF